MSDENIVTHNQIDSKIKNEVVLKRHVCKICGKAFKRFCDLSRHGSVHTSEKLFPCGDHCTLSFADKHRLNQHHKSISLEPSHQCDICQKKFKVLHSLKKHLRTHTKEKPFPCDMCNKKYGSIEALEYHYGSQSNLEYHRQFKEFEQFEYLIEKCKKKYDKRTSVTHTCSVCNKHYRTAQGLIAHCSVHVTDLELPYMCELCHKRFQNESGLKIHKVCTHSIEKSYICDICPKRYNNQSSLYCHMNTHNEQPFVCELCNKKFNYKTSFKNHLKTHIGQKPYARVCEVCNKKFQTSVMLQRHMKIHVQTGNNLCNKDNSFVTSQ